MRFGDKNDSIKRDEISMYLIDGIRHIFSDAESLELLKLETPFNIRQLTSLNILTEIIMRMALTNINPRPFSEINKDQKLTFKVIKNMLNPGVAEPVDIELLKIKD